MNSKVTYGTYFHVNYQHLAFYACWKWRQFGWTWCAFFICLWNLDCDTLGHMLSTNIAALCVLVCNKNYSITHPLRLYWCRSLKKTGQELIDQKMKTFALWQKKARKLIDANAPRKGETNQLYFRPSMCGTSASPCRQLFIIFDVSAMTLWRHQCNYLQAIQWIVFISNLMFLRCLMTLSHMVLQQSCKMSNLLNGAKKRAYYDLKSQKCWR